MKNLFLSHRLQDFSHHHEAEESTLQTQDKYLPYRCDPISNEGTQDSSSSSTAKNRNVFGTKNMLVEETVNVQTFQSEKESLTKKQNELHRRLEGIIFLLLDR
jgi:hypothetical protein